MHNLKLKINNIYMGNLKLKNKIIIKMIYLFNKCNKYYNND